MLQRTSLVAVMLSMSMAACGGGGGSDTAVSASPAAPVPSPSPSASPAPGAVATPAPGAVATPAPGSAPAPVVAPGVATPVPAPSAPAPSAATPAVSGPIVLAALTAGVSPAPNPEGSPYTDFRKVVASDNSYYFIGDALTSYTIGGGFPNASGFGLTGVVAIEPQVSNGVITSVKANGLTLEGSPLDLRNANPAIDASAGTWTSGQWFATLLVQSVSGQPDRMRVCWNAHLPPPPPVTGPPGFTPLVREAPFKRLMCGVYSNKQVGPDVGGYISDDFAGTVTVYSAAW